MTKDKRKRTGPKTALQAKRAPSGFEVDPETIYVETDPKSPRYDSKSSLPVSEEQLQIYRSNGQGAPLLCRKNGDRVEIVDGRQRLKVALEDNRRRKAEGQPLAMVTIVLKRVVDDSQFFMLRKVYNLRVEETPSGKAMSIYQAVEQLQIPRDLVALWMGFKGEHAAKSLEIYLDLHVLAPEVKQAIDSEALPLKETVAHFKKIRQEDQAAELAKYLAGGRSDGKKNGHANTKTKSGRPPMGFLKKVAATKVGLDGEAGAFLAGVRFSAGAMQRDAVLESWPNLAAVLSPPADKATENEAAR